MILSNLHNFCAAFPLKKYVIYLPTEYQGVHKSSFRNVRAFRIELELENQQQVENQQQTQPTYDAGSGNRTRDTLVEGERSHHYAMIPTPRCSLLFKDGILQTLI